MAEAEQLAPRHYEEGTGGASLVFLLRSPRPQTQASVSESIGAPSLRHPGLTVPLVGQSAFCRCFLQVGTWDRTPWRSTLGERILREGLNPDLTRVRGKGPGDGLCVCVVSNCLNTECDASAVFVPDIRVQGDVGLCLGSLRILSGPALFIQMLIFFLKKMDMEHR